MVATVITADMDAVAQSAAGVEDALRRRVDLEAALAARAERRRRLEKLRESVRA